MIKTAAFPCVRLRAAYVVVCLVVIAALLSNGAAAQSVVESGPKIWLQANQPLPVQHVPAAQGPATANLAGLNAAQPVSMAAADLDADGFQELVVGYSSGGAGFISIQRGNVDAFAPQSDESFQAIGRGEFPSPFQLEAQTFSVPIRPDFIALGNFLGNGNNDLVIAAKGGSVLYFFPGDGKGNFDSPLTLNISGGVQSLAEGEFGSSHQHTLLVGVSGAGKNKSSLLVFVGSGQGITEPVTVPVTGSISNILFGEFGDRGPDAAFLAGNTIQILRSSTMTVVPVNLPVSVSAFALGSFLFDRNEGRQIAVLGADGSVSIAARSEFDPRAYTVEEFGSIRLAKRLGQPVPLVPARTFANGWKIVESFPSVAAISPTQAPVFLRTRISVNGADDIMWLNAAGGEMVLISHPDQQPGASTFNPGQVSVKPYTGTPLTAVPMRINVDGRLGVMALHQGDIAPSMSMPIPDPNFFVNTDNDPTPTAPIAQACKNTSFADLTSSCSLREAVLKANGDTIMLQAGHTYSLTRGRVTATPNYSGDHGALYVNNTATIVGGNQNTTIIQWGTPAPAGTTVDMVMAVNEDINPITNATASISNLTIQGGVNHGTHGNDGDGGCMEFDTGGNGNQNLTLTNVTLQNCATTQGNGGGIAMFNFTHATGTGAATITGSTFKNNSAVDSVTTGTGGGVWSAVDNRLTMSSSQILNNLATHISSDTFTAGVGGGITLTSDGPASNPATIHSTTISGNTAGGFGGGMWAETNLTMDQGSVISNNSAGSANKVNQITGGGMEIQIFNGDSATLTKVAITGNSATGGGGGIHIGSFGGGTFPTDGPLTISFSRFAGNTAGTVGSNLSNVGTTVTATNNWWGTNAAGSTISTTIAGATTTFDPFIVLTHATRAPALQTIKINGTTTLTGDMSADNHGTAVGLANLTEIIGLPITFNGAVLGTIPQAQPETLNANAQATATFNAGAASGFGTANATVDQAVVPVNSNLIASATEAGTTATITTVGAHFYSPGEFVRISGVGVAGYNSSPSTQVFAIIATPTATTFTYSANASGLGASSGGTANASIVVLQPPSITKTFSPKTIQTTSGTGINPKASTITFAVTNANVVPIDANFTDTLPSVGGPHPGSLVVAATPAVTNTCGGTVTATAGSGTISFTNAALPVGTCSITVNVSSTVDDSYNNSVTINSTIAGNGNTASDTLTVINPPTSAKAFGASSIPLNTTTSLTITLSTTNQNLGLSGVAFTDSLPAGVVVATPNNLSNTCGGTATAVAGSSSVALAGASLAAGAAPCTVSVNVLGTTAGNKSNSVTASDTTAGTGNTASASLIVVAPPSIAKAFNPTSVPVNGTSALTFTITNPVANTVAEAGVAFTDTLPAGLVVATPNGLTNSCGGTPTAVAGTTSISLTGGSIAVNSNCTVVVNVTAGATPGIFTNTSGVVSSTNGGNGNTASADLHVNAPPTIAKAFNPNSIALNANSTLTFTITNPALNPDPAAGVAFSDTLPAGLVVATPNGLTNTCGGTATATAGSTTISLTGGTVAVNSTCTVVVNVKGTTAGVFTNTSGAVSSTNGGTGNTASDTLTVVAPPSIAKAFSPTTIPLNGTSTLTFTITNPAANTVAQAGVAFTDTLPAGLVVATPNGLVDNCGGTATATAGSTSISLTGGTVAVNTSCTVVVNVTGTAAGALVNTSGAVSSTNGGTGNTATATLTVIAPPTISKAFGAASIPLNGTTTVTFTISNPNTTAAGDLTGVAFSDTLPSTTGTLVVGTPPGVANTCTGTVTATAGTGVISLAGGSVAHGASCTLTVNVTGTAAGDAANTTGAISSTQGGTGNPSNTATIKIVAPPSIAKAFNPSTIALNATTSLTFTITNPAANTAALTGVAFTDTLPTGLTVATATSSVCGGTLTTTAPTGIALTGATIATGGQCQFPVTVTGAASGQYTNTTGAVTSTNGGTGNTATANLTVASPPSITKAFGVATIPLNGSTSLTFNISNPNTNVTLNGIAFTDNLPSGLVVASTPNLTNTCGGTATAVGGAGTVSLSGGTLAATASCSISVNVQGTTAGVKNNSVQVTSTEGGTGNTSNASITVVGPPVIIKAFGAASIPLNGSTSLQFTIQNNNTGTSLSGVAFSDTLPAGLVVSTPNGLTGTCGGGTITATQGTNVISLSGATLAGSASCTFSVNVTGTAAGLQNNTTGNVTSTEGGTGGTASASLNVEAPPSIAKAFNPSTIALNATTSLTFTITNPGANVNALTGVAFTDTLPTGLTVANATATICGGTVTTTAPTGISLTGATIAANGQCQFSVTVTGAASGQYTNTTGAVTSTNGGTGNTASANLSVASSPTISKAFNPTTIALSQTSTLTFTINNPNTNVALTGLAFTDNFPSGVVVAATPNASNTCSGTFTPVAGASSVSLSSGTLAASGTCTLSVDVQGTTAGAKVNTTGPISSNEGGTGTTSNSAILTVTKGDTTTTVTSSVNPSVFGESVTFTATVSAVPPASGIPGGTVTFLDNNVSIGTAPLVGGVATLTTSALSVGGHPITTTYAGDSNFNGSNGTLTGNPQVVNEAFSSTIVISSVNPSILGQSVTFTATVSAVLPGSGIPQGQVTFLDNGNPIGTVALSLGVANLTTSALTIGNHTITTTYPGDGNFTGSNGSLVGNPQVVTKPNTSITLSPSANPIHLGDTVTFSSTVTVNPPGSGTPTGFVTFFDGATPLGNGFLSGGQTTFPTALLSVGGHSITAIYNGDANFNASPAASLTETVDLRMSTSAVALNPTTVGAGQASTITTTVTDAGGSAPPGTPNVFSSTGAPGTGRTGFTATLIGDGIVVITGGTDTNNNVLQSAEVYTGGSFNPTPGQLNTARTGAVAVLLPNSKVLIAGGSSNGAATGALNSAELLDLTTGTFTPSANNMTAARFGATITLLNTGKVLIAGGANSGGALNSAELYDPAAATFTATGNLNAARTGASATLLGTGKVLVAGGSSDGTGNGALSSAEVFDPAGNGGAGTFTSVAGSNPTLSTGRWQPEAALLLSGAVLIAGGQNSGGPLTSADLYDPAADSFTASSHAMNEARANGSAIALPNGMVLLPGGTTSKTVDLYDGDSDRFNTTGSLLHFDNGLVATLLNNGQVLVVGINTDNDPTLLSDAELYSPAFNPLGTVNFISSEPTDAFGAVCVLVPSSSTASTCTSTVTPQQVATSPHSIFGTYLGDDVHSTSTGTASLTVIPTAPPTIAKAFSQQNVAQNGTVSVSFTINNPNAAATLTGISFTDSLPAGLVVATPNNLNNDCGGTVTAVPGSSSISMTGGTLAPPGPPPIRPQRNGVKANLDIASGECVVSVNLLVTGTGTLSNTTGPISANESGPGNPSNTASINVVNAPTVNKAFGAASVPVGGSTSLTFNIANPNTAVALDGIGLTDALPSGLVVANPNGLAGSCVASSTITATAGSGTISLANLDLAATGSCSFSVNVTGTSAGAKNNTTGNITGTYDDGTGTFRVISGGTASASLSVVAPPSIAKAFNPSVIGANGVSTLTFTITNPPANVDPETGVAFTDSLPANVLVATPNGATGTCNGGTLTAVAGSGNISFTGGTVPASGSCAVAVNVTSAVPGVYNNTSGAVSSTNGGTGNTAKATLTVAHANLTITKTHQGTFKRGQTGAVWTITVSASATGGPTDGTTVTVTDTLPNVTHPPVPTAISGTGWTCVLATLTCTRADALAAGASYPAISLTVNIPQDIVNHFTNTVAVSGGGDPNSHQATDDVFLGPPIIITSTDSGAATIHAGSTATFQFQVDTTGVDTQPAVVSFTCSGLPAGTACIFSPLATGQPVSQMTMTITSIGPNNSSLAPGRHSAAPTYAALLFPVMGLIGVGFAGRKRKGLRMRLTMMLMGLLLLAALAGCGGSPLTTPAGQSTITVTGTANSATGPVSGTATVSLTVQK